MSQFAVSEEPANAWSSLERPELDRAWQVAFWLAALLATVPLVGEYLVGLLKIDHYQYVPLALLCVAGLAWARSDREVYLPRNWFTWLWVLAGLFALLVAIYLHSPWIGMASFVLLSSAWLFTSREPDGRSLIGLSLPLLMVLRLPLGWDAELIIRLQRWTTRLASYLLDVVRIPHYTHGNVIGLGSRELFVAEACSGIQSVFTLLFLASLWVAYRRYPLWYAPVYWCVAIMAAILGNAVRVGLVAIGDVWLGVDWATGTSHELVGYFALVLATLLLLSFDQFFRCWLHPILSATPDNRYIEDPLVRVWDRWITGSLATHRLWHEEEETYGSTVARSDGSGRGDSRQPSWTPPIRWVYAHVWIGGFLGVMSLLLVVGTSVANSRTDPLANRVDSFVPSDSVLGDRVGRLAVLDHEIARDGAEQRLGLAADIWTIGDDRLQGQVVLSQPYFGWHELCVCYENIQWRLVDRAVLTAAVPADADGGGSREYAMARFRNHDNRYGYLWFSAITYDGTSIAPPPGLGTISRLGRRFNTDHVYDGELMMLQLWVESPQRLEPDDLQLLKESFEQARGRIMREAATSAGVSLPRRESEGHGDSARPERVEEKDGDLSGTDTGAAT